MIERRYGALIVDLSLHIALLGCGEDILCIEDEEDRLRAELILAFLRGQALLREIAVGRCSRERQLALLKLMDGVANLLIDDLVLSPKDIKIVLLRCYSLSFEKEEYPQFYTSRGQNVFKNSMSALLSASLRLGSPPLK